MKLLGKVEQRLGKIWLKFEDFWISIRINKNVRMRCAQLCSLKAKLVLGPFCELISGEIKDLSRVALILKVVTGYQH